MDKDLPPGTAVQVEIALGMLDLKHTTTFITINLRNWGEKGKSGKLTCLSMALSSKLSELVECSL